MKFVVEEFDDRIEFLTWNKKHKLDNSDCSLLTDLFYSAFKKEGKWILLFQASKTRVLPFSSTYCHQKLLFYFFLDFYFTFVSLYLSFSPLFLFFYFFFLFSNSSHHHCSLSRSHTQVSPIFCCRWLFKVFVLEKEQLYKPYRPRPKKPKM